MPKQVFLRTKDALESKEIARTIGSLRERDGMCKSLLPYRTVQM